MPKILQFRGGTDLVRQSTPLADRELFITEDSEGLWAGTSSPLVHRPLSSGFTLTEVSAPTVTRTYTMSSPGDTNGCINALRYLAADPAQDPITSGIISAIASSTLDSDRIDKGLFDRGARRVNTSSLTDAWFSSNVSRQWIAFDIGAGRTITPNRYAFQNANESNYMRNWKLQGSTNPTVGALTLGGIPGWTWVDLFTHVADTEITTPNQWISRAISSVTGYRYFRLLSTGTTSAGSNLISCGDLELYGTMSRTAQLTSGNNAWYAPPSGAFLIQAYKV